MAKEIFTPREIISRYIDRNTTKESGTVSVRGIYSRNDDAGNLSKQWVFDKLIDEISGATLKLNMPRSPRDFIQDGQNVEMSGCESYHLLLPIPQSELDRNPDLIQNSGF